MSSSHVKSAPSPRRGRFPSALYPPPFAAPACRPCMPPLHAAPAAPAAPAALTGNTDQVSRAPQAVVDKIK